MLGKYLKDWKQKGINYYWIKKQIEPFHNNLLNHSELVYFIFFQLKYVTFGSNIESQVLVTCVNCVYWWFYDTLLILTFMGNKETYILLFLK